MKTVRTQAERRADAEIRIIGATIELIATQGLNKLTLTQVAEQAGYSRYVPIHYYGRKDNLVAATVADLITTFSSYQVDLEGADRGLQRLIGMIDIYIAVLVNERTKSAASQAILAAALTSRDILALVGEHTSKSLAYIEDEILAGIAAGNIRADADAKASAVIILGFLRGITPLSLIHDAVDPQATRNAVVQWITSALSAGPSTRGTK